MAGKFQFDILKQLVELAFQYGPFVFAMLFCLWITRWGYQNYKEACTRKDPVASKDEIKTLKEYFRACYIFGMILVAVSIVWYFHFQASTHVFEGRIEGLRDYDTTSSSTLFLRPVYQQPNVEGLPLFHQDHFIIAQKSPFKNTDSFDITIFKKDRNGESPPILKNFTIPYAKGGYIKLKYEVDPTTNQPGLMVASEEKSVYSINIIRSAYAGLKVGDFLKKSNEGGKVIIPENYDQIKEPLVLPIEDHIKRLQEEKTSAAGKIDALKKLDELPKEKLEGHLATIITPEPLFLTILDLTRHTDPDISSSAIRFVEQHIDLLKYFDDQTQKGPLQNDHLTAIVFRLDQKTAKKVLAYCGSEKNYSWAVKAKEELESGRSKLSPLIPSASFEGDRYYIEAVWNKENKEITTCLTNLFFKSLIHKRTLKEEEEIMKDRNKRVVYWYSKRWALDIAKKIESCGAVSKFVGY